MKTDKINRLVRDFLHGDMPEEIQRRFRRWMTAPADRETKDAALFQAWKELLARPAERDYRHKLPPFISYQWARTPLKRQWA